MKKLFVIMLIIAMAFCFASCGGSSEGGSNDSETTPQVDMSSYPSDIQEWTSENFIEYFDKQGILPISEDLPPGVGSHADEWGGTPIHESIIWSFTEDDPGSFAILVYKDAGDVSEEEMEYWKNCIDTDRTMPYEYATFGKVDHLVGNVGFLYSGLALNDELAETIEDAYQQFLKDTGFTPEF